MCGIAGFLDFKKGVTEQNLNTLNKMTNSLEHRGPDSGGVWCDSEQGLYIGHRRLAIIDLSPEGHQPMESDCERYVISYNGEIYNFQELKQGLLKKGCSLRGGSDTEVLINYIALFGLKKTLSAIKGMFAFVLWDKKTRCLTFVRDHIGKKPLYIGTLDKKIVFGSELKVFHAACKNRLEIDTKAFNQYSQYGYVPGPHSIYKNVYKLKAGHSLSFDLSSDAYSELERGDLSAAMQPYWSIADVATQPYNDKGAADLKDILLESVKQRMVSDVSVGAFLSGGIDSSLIVALMQEVSRDNVKTFTIGFEEDEYDESAYAEDVARHLGTEHNTHIITGEETRAIIPDLSSVYDEPFADYSQIPTYHICKKAKAHSTVALSGDGGDEVFCGYSRYFMTNQLFENTKQVPRFIRNQISKMLLSVSAGTLDKMGSSLPLLNKKIQSLSLSGNRLHSIAHYLSYGDLEELIRLVHVNNFSTSFLKESKGGYNDTYDNKSYIRSVDHALEKMMLIDTDMYLPDDILVKTDRASMANSLEVRSPLLDKDVIEWSWRQPLEDKLNVSGRSGKKHLYDMLCQYVPSSLIDRPKQGFSVPMSKWLRGDLNSWASDLLSKEALEQSSLYDVDKVQKLWARFNKGDVNCANSIWTILMAQSWHSNWHK